MYETPDWGEGNELPATHFKQCTDLDNTHLTIYIYVWMCNMMFLYC